MSRQAVPLSLATQGIRVADLTRPTRQRLTFGWIQDGEPVVLPQDPHTWATVAVVWPTLPDGSMPQHGEPQAMLVQMTEPQLHELLAVHRRWSLARHDAWAMEGRFSPCSLCLRRSPHYGVLVTHIEAMIRLLTSFRGDVPPMSPHPAIGSRTVARPW